MAQKSNTTSKKVPVSSLSKNALKPHGVGGCGGGSNQQKGASSYGQVAGKGAKNAC